VRRTRAHQYLFVNKRPVSDGALRHAVYKAYEGFIAKEDHPVFFLSLRISPSTVDVNVHPAKKEIRFLDREEVYHFMLHSVRDALSEGKKDNEKTDSPHSDLRSVGGYPEPFSLNRSAQFPGEAGESGISFAVSESQELFCNTAGQFMYLGDVFAAYHDAGRLCIIDHHAAHERILYEKLKNGIGLDSYRLLFPRQVRLSAKEYSVILEYRKVFETMGMEIEDFGGNTVIVRTLPSVLDEKEMGSLLSDLALRIMDVCANSPLDIVRDEIAKKMACHSSVRGPRLLGNEKLDALIHDLEETDDPHHCPHGRPTRICFSLDDLRKLFERK
jgi:DNA mismatch repair protein MutL